MKHVASSSLSRRERQIMDIIYQRSTATAAEVQEGIKDAPSYSAVRALLAVLVKKGFLQIEEAGPRYVYKPTHPKESAGNSAIKDVVRTFFEGSIEKAVAALLEDKDTELSKKEFDRLRAMIDQARKEGS